jgi:hypothetical protein
MHPSNHPESEKSNGLKWTLINSHTNYGSSSESPLSLLLTSSLLSGAWRLTWRKTTASYLSGGRIAHEIPRVCLREMCQNQRSRDCLRTVLERQRMRGECSEERKSRVWTGTEGVIRDSLLHCYVICARHFHRTKML